ncbi:MAG: hypothetical protein KGQ52_02380 [Alphaproteobacteria bacterium]|nr:hypothetical protein [Alphaproteobacteria bacterium]
MRRWLAPVAAAALISACSGVDEKAAHAVVDRFHAALNAGDWPAIDALLTKDARALRPGIGTARAFGNLIDRHGRYQGGELAGISAEDGRTTLAWAAKYEKGPVSELFVLREEGGSLKIESFTDNPLP